MHGKKEAYSFRAKTDKGRLCDRFSHYFWY